MTTLSNLAFKFSFNGASLVADPVGVESMHDAMRRCIADHAGSLVSEIGRCKLVSGNYTYPITLSNGSQGMVVIEGNAE